MQIKELEKKIQKASKAKIGDLDEIQMLLGQFFAEN